MCTMPQPTYNQTNSHTVYILHIHSEMYTHEHKCVDIYTHTQYHSMTSSLQIANGSLLLRLVAVLAILSKKCTSVYICIHVYTCPSMISVYIVCYTVATISRLLNIIGLFCKRALLKRRYSAKETYNLKEPASHS